MASNYFNKDKSIGQKKKRINWQQSLKSQDANNLKPQKIKKSLQYS